MAMFFKLYLIALPVFLAIDMVWLVLVARRFYVAQIGGLLKADVNKTAAVGFYLLFVLGLVMFVINPAVQTGSWLEAAWLGAWFGLITYATYDLTNLATLKDWPLKVVVVDMAWGVVLAVTVSSATYFIATAIGL